jgi:tetrahydromethanopterin S-methyltransferase subunit H
MKLEGSEKQVAWAEELLKKFDTSINEIVANCEDRIQRFNDKPEKAEIVARSQETIIAIKKFREWVFDTDNAGWVIDHLGPRGGSFLNKTSGIGLTDKEVNHINRAGSTSEWPIPRIHNI